ncbi:MAG: hypothetical protein ABEH78_01240 [Haloferacaceae archaeon]
MEGNPVLEIDDTTVREGTAFFDTEFDRVLWIVGIDEYEITVEVAEPYRDDEPFWWSTGGDPTRVADGSRITVDTFRSVVERGRFEIGAQPPEPEAVP